MRGLPDPFSTPFDMTSTTIGPACRAVSRETLSKTIHWAVEQATTLGWNQQRIVTYLEQALSRSLQKSSYYDRMTYVDNGNWKPYL